MTDLPTVSVSSASTSLPFEFRVGHKVEVNNLDQHGMPGPFHACRGEIRMLFSHEGQVAATVEFGNGVQRKMLVSKLMLILPKSKPLRPPPVPPTPAPSLPKWAKLGCIMVRGDQLQEKDIVYFSANANPRVLKQWLDARAWSGDTLISWHGFDKAIPGAISITPNYWYVVERK